MKPLIAALLAGSVLSAPAFAEAIPSPGPRDARLRTVAYDPGNVTVVICAPGRSTSVELAPTEIVDSVTVGDDKAWVVAPAGNRVFITPDDGDTGRNSNMQVVAVRPDGSTRLYQIDLVLSADASRSMSGIRYIYPDDARADRAAAAAKAREGAETRVAEDRLAVDFMYGARNWRFLGRGSRAIEPTEVSDNGRVTAMRFPASMKRPTIATGQCGDKEAIAPVTPRDDLAVVQTTSEYFCLRLGGEVTELHNFGYSPYGYNPQTGTSTPEVVRTIRKTWRASR